MGFTKNQFAIVVYKREGYMLVVMDYKITQGCIGLYDLSCPRLSRGSVSFRGLTPE